ncbi:hypothetical protein GCM10022222_57170 [Amycolatopsis ultiminotia]|uniref:Transposase n=1 Tax=Amycolatopsis ultiminotia TaxID=543629 RepID=A0ABP6XK20_9PSEU
MSPGTEPNYTDLLTESPDHAKCRSRIGWSTKAHRDMADGNGRPLVTVIEPGQAGYAANVPAPSCGGCTSLARSGPHPARPRPGPTRPAPHQRSAGMHTVITQTNA